MTEHDPYEYRSVFDGYRSDPGFHDWTDQESAEDEAEAFRALGCAGVRVEKRRFLPGLRPPHNEPYVHRHE